MLLKIKPHSPEEKPSHSCQVIMAMTYQKPITIDYSEKYDAWNCIDGITEEDAALMSMDTDNMIGWVYADEVFWQIVLAMREAGHEVY